MTHLCYCSSLVSFFLFFGEAPLFDFNVHVDVCSRCEQRGHLNSAASTIVAVAAASKARVPAKVMIVSLLLREIDPRNEEGRAGNIGK